MGFENEEVKQKIRIIRIFLKIYLEGYEEIQKFRDGGLIQRIL